MDKHRVAIVSTSINAAPIAYKAWSELGTLIVAGDVNSPNELRTYVNDVCHGFYLPWETQNQRTPGGHHIGWRNIQRRNAATWFALTGDFDWIVTVDDDNIPTSDDWVGEHVKNMQSRVKTTLGSRSGFLNTGALCIPQFHQRGVPYGVDTTPYVERYDFGNTPPYVVVSQSQVVGDPDCDAVDRIANAPSVSAVSFDAVITPGTYAAFNTQATVWSRAWAPLLAVMPGVGRYDDIFGSYIFHRLAKSYNVAMYVGTPCVRQDRNEHDLAKDLRAELWGMNRCFDFVAALNAAHIDLGMPLWMAYSELIAATSHILPDEAVKFAQAWAGAWRDQL